MWTGAIIHKFHILICSGAPEISREVREVARARVQPVCGDGADQYSVTVGGISENAATKTTLQLFRDDFLICFSSLPPVSVRRGLRVSRRAVSRELTGTCLCTVTAQGD